MHSSWLVTSLVLGFLLQVFPVLVASISLSDCRNWQFLLTGDNRCQGCPACPAGQMFTKHCGYGKIIQAGARCKPCEDGTYKTKKSIYACQDCSSGCGEHREVIHTCNATHNLKCGDCKKGFYLENGGCRPCQHCCGQQIFNPNSNKEYVREKCWKDGMGHCSCRPIIGCTKKCPINTTTMKPNTLGTSKTHSIPTISTKITRKQTISPSTEVSTLDPFSTEAARHGSNSELSTKNTIGAVDPGWLVALAICVLLLSVIIFFVFKHMNIVKKFKVLLYNYESTTPESRDGDDETSTIVCVGGRFESAAEPNSTNYAQLVDSVEDNCETDSCPSQQHQAFVQHHANPSDEANSLMCTCHLNEGCSLSSDNGSAEAVPHAYDAPGGPWVYREPANHRQPERWPPSRAEMGNRAAVLYGEYVKLHHETSTNSPSTQGDVSVQVDEPSNDSTDSQQANVNTSTNDDNKEGEEHSEAEETVEAVPVTIGTAEENTVVIATGQHSGTISRVDIPKVSKMTSERVREKRKKKQEPKKSKKKTTSDSVSDKVSPSESLQCTCGKCSYRPIVRDMQLCNCTNCVPQPDDDLYKVIERRCLRAEICKELNKNGVPNWRDLSIYMRIDKQIPDIENSVNPSHMVLERLKTSRPRIKLDDFSVILKKIRRHDVMDVIMRHHITCVLCRRNSFDGSLQDLHIQSESEPWATMKTIVDL